MFASECAEDGDGTRKDVKAATVAAAAAAEEEDGVADAVVVVTPLAVLGSRDAASKRCWGAMEDALTELCCWWW